MIDDSYKRFGIYGSGSSVANNPAAAGNYPPDMAQSGQVNTYQNPHIFQQYASSAQQLAAQQYSMSNQYFYNGQPTLVYPIFDLKFSQYKNVTILWAYYDDSYKEVILEIQ